MPRPQGRARVEFISMGPVLMGIVSSEIIVLDLGEGIALILDICFLEIGGFLRFD